MQNIKLTIQYDGTKYRGWQRLKNPDLTVQGKIENVLSKMTEENIEIIGSGRTDGGVHALNQVANFKTKSSMKPHEIQDYCYKYLPEDIVVTRVNVVDERFHARFNAKGKKYIYRILNTKYHDPFLRGFVNHIPERLDIEAIKQASAYIIGEHDFSSFTSTKAKKKSKVREIHEINISKKEDVIEIMFYGNGFLYNMVRIIVGTLIEVGTGEIKPEKIKDILNKEDRQFAGPTAPPQGLFLYDVEY